MQNFPMANATPPRPQQVESFVRAGTSDRPSVVRVLAVDDERAASKLLAIMLRPPSYCCSTATSGEEALVALQREPFDAVISDLQMPGISGLDLLS
jgi:CheY-like chemotaxis protein